MPNCKLILVPTVLRAQDLYESRGGRPGLSVPDSPDGLCGRTATLNCAKLRAQDLCESRGGRPGLPVRNNPYGLCGRKASLNERDDRVASGVGTFSPKPPHISVPAGTSSETTVFF